MHRNGSPTNTADTGEEAYKFSGRLTGDLVIVSSSPIKEKRRPASASAAGSSSSSSGHRDKDNDKDKDRGRSKSPSTSRPGTAHKSSRSSPSPGAARVRPTTAGAIRPLSLRVDTDAAAPGSPGNNNNSGGSLSRSQSRPSSSMRGLPPSTKALLADDKPRVFVCSEGQPDNQPEVLRLVRGMVRKGMVVYLHSGGPVGTSQSVSIHGAPNAAAEREAFSPVRGQWQHGQAPVTPSATFVSLAGAGTSGALPPVSRPGSAAAISSGSRPGSASAGGKGKKKMNKKKKADADADPPGGGTSPVASSGGTAQDFARARVADEITEMLHASTLFVGCVTRNYTYNANCKKVTLWCKEMINANPRTAPDMRYLMMHGTFTTESQPYHCRGGWLGYLLRGSLWSPAWSKAHVVGAVEAILGNTKLRRSRVKLDPRHLLYIDSRGRQGVCPPCFMKAR